jgi:septum site-determining protein MinC
MFRRSIRQLQIKNVLVCSKSSRAAAASKYIDMWLGDDLKGDRHLRNVVNGAYSASSAQKQQLQKAAIVSASRLTAPVVSVDWMANSSVIATELAGSGLANTCFLDMSNAPSTLTADKVNEILNLALECGMTPVAAVNADGCDAAVLADADLPVLKGWAQAMPQAQTSSASKPSITEAVKEASADEKQQPFEAKPSLVYTGTVRSGQQLYAEGTSLVIVGSVNAGAELLADGDIHVYGKLAGRAIAGLSGDESARVFAKQFQPSLVGIADGFATIDDLETNPAFGKFVSVAIVNASDRVEGANKHVFQCSDEHKFVMTVME